MLAYQFMLCNVLLFIIDSQIVEYVTANVYAVYDLANNDLVTGKKFLTGAELLLFWHSGSQSQTPSNVLTGELRVIIRSVVGSASGGSALSWLTLTPSPVESPCRAASCRVFVSLAVIEQSLACILFRMALLQCYCLKAV